MSSRPFDLIRAVRDLPLPPPPPLLTASDKMVLALLAMRADASGFSWTSYTKLAANCWMSVRTAKVSIARLVAAGLVEIRVRRVDDGEDGKLARAANGYQVLVKVVSEVVQPQHEVVQLPHELVQQLHEGSAATAPGVVQPLHGGGAVTAHRSAPGSAPPRSFALTRDEGGAERAPKKANKQPKHTPDEILAKQAVIDAFIAAVKEKKGVEPTLNHSGDHAAAFQLAKTYGEEAPAIVRRALEDDFVASKNCTLRYIGSKADSFRGAAPVKARGHHMVQPPAAPGERCWQAGDGT
jgi:hypothetical protein